MSLIVTSEGTFTKFVAPNLPLAPYQYDSRYQEQFNNVLRLYFNQIDALLGQLMATSGVLSVQAGGTGADAFGRLRVSNPFTLFDSQNRYGKDPQFDETLTTSGTSTYLPNESSVEMAVTTTSGSEVVRQTYRVFPYQPGKSLLVLCTFKMAAGVTNLRQRAGYFSTENGVFFQKTGTTNQFVLRSYTSGTASDARTVDQADWNGDKLDGTGASGYTLDSSKAQILFLDFEWLGVGSVRCGFVINGQFIVCHTFNNANDVTGVYMTTAILPVRYEITATNTLSAAQSMKQICSSVASEGGYQQAVAPSIARRTTALGSIGTTFLPLVSIRLASDSLGAVVLPQEIQVLPTAAGDFEIALFKNATLTGASYNTSDFAHVDYDVTATALSGGTIVQLAYTSGSNKTGVPLATPSGYNFDLQLGVSLAGVSDVYTLAVRVLSGTSSAIGSISFIDLTD